MQGVTLFITQALQITMIDLALSGDNVGVIALAIRNLPAGTANRAKIFGITCAVGLRIFFAIIVSTLFSISGLHVDFIGGLLLLYITWSMIRDDSGKDVRVSAGKSFLTAVASIVLADASMSLDNVLAIASVAMKESGGNAVGPKEAGLIVFGLTLCIPVIFFGSGIVARLMKKFPVIIYLCAGILVHTSCKMIFSDTLVSPFAGNAGGILSIAAAAAVVAYGAVRIAWDKRKGSTDMLSFVWNRGLDGFEDAEKIRRKVFVEEQGFQREFDDTDKVCYHVTGYLDGAPAATGRLFRDGEDVYHAGRIAVAKPYRGKKYGAQLMREIIRKAEELGARDVVLGAQKQAEGFYEKLGFVPYGDVFFDEGCPHVHMKIRLSNPD